MITGFDFYEDDNNESQCIIHPKDMFLLITNNGLRRRESRLLKDSWNTSIHRVMLNQFTKGASIQIRAFLVATPFDLLQKTNLEYTSKLILYDKSSCQIDESNPSEPVNFKWMGESRPLYLNWYLSVTNPEISIGLFIKFSADVVIKNVEVCIGHWE